MTDLHSAETADTAQLQAQIVDLRQTLETIRLGGVDAVIAGPPGEEQVYTLTSADRPYRLIVEEMNEGAVTTSRHGVVLFANPNFMRMVDATRQLAGTLITDLVEPDDRSSVAELFVLAPGARARVEVRLRAERGPVPVILAASCLEIEGTPVVCLIASDLTAQKEVEETLRDNEQRLTEWAARLEKLNHELERSNTELEQFAYAASHDLSEPLRAISGHVSLLAARYKGRLGPEADESIAFAVDGCTRMQQTIRDLLIYSRVGRIEEPATEVECADAVREALSALQLGIEKSDAEVTVEPLPVVVAEPGQLVQIFTNLISNAIKFVAPGVRPRVTVAAERGHGEWRFTVTDNGIGVAERHRERIFGMFKRLNPSDQYPGTGIGLALVRKSIERHGGRAGVEDAPSGTGSQFWFTIPDPDRVGPQSVAG